MKYECIKAFDGLGCSIGDVLEVERDTDGNYVIDGACSTSSEIVYEFFKKKSLDGWKYAPYSFSKMDSWVSCANKFNYNYIIRPPRTAKPSPILEKGTLFHAVLEFDCVDNLDNFEITDTFSALSIDDSEAIIGQALEFTVSSEIYKWIKSLDGLKVPEQEMFLGGALEPVETLEDSLIRGFIDLIIYDEDTNKCYIFDWKTGGKSKEALIKWPKPKDQLELYAIWAHQVFGATHIEAAFVYVEHEHKAQYTFMAADIPQLIKKFQYKINHIEKDQAFSKNLTTLCLWCDFKELCLGIPQDSDPYRMTKADVFEYAAKDKKRPNKPSSKNTAFLNKIKARVTT